MSKRNRNTDNSKRPQPLQQQRAQARQGAGGASNKADTHGKTDTNGQSRNDPARQDGRPDQR